MQSFSPLLPNGSKEPKRPSKHDSPRHARAPQLANHDLFDGKYEIIECIGKGATSLVFRVKHRVLDRELAVKVLVAGRDAIERQRFIDEARMLARVSHPGIVRVHTFHDHEYAPFVSMDFVDGQSLQQVMDTRRLTVEECIRLSAMIAAALAVAHDNGIVHRDVKPANVMLTGKPMSLMPVLVDFGSGLLKGARKQGSKGKINGTPAYMSPEQFNNAHVDSRADVYSLGCMMYEMVSGNLPFAATGVRRAAMAHAYDAPAALSGSTPHWLAELISAMLAKNPDERPESMREVERALVERRFQAGVRNSAVTKFFDRLLKTVFTR